MLAVAQTLVTSWLVIIKMPLPLSSYVSLCSPIYFLKEYSQLKTHPSLFFLQV